MKKHFFFMPNNSKKFHIYDNDTHQSICGNSLLLLFGHPDKDFLTGNEVMQKDDCKLCYKAAVKQGLIKKEEQ